MYLLVLVCAVLQAAAELPPTCDSEIYCRGELLEDVQMSRIYQDSKTFVDKRMLFPEKEILKKYRTLKDTYGGVPPKNVLQDFVNENFEDGNELDVWTPSDWSESPAILQQIEDPSLRDWARSLNELWKTLSRKVDEKVKQNPELFSIMYVPNGFVIPGGRFKELYYWDTFWIVNGLLICDMVQTAKGVIENLLYLLKTIGHIPNGSRVYYIQRTQPPLITQMVHSYYKHSGDFDFVEKNIQLLDNEVDYWIKNRRVGVEKGGKKYKMFRYYAPSAGPRPESYREDVETAKFSGGAEERQDMYTSLKSGAESGWDFSTRWFVQQGTNRGNISNIHTSYIIPVDLNALLHRNFKILLGWYTKLGNTEKIRKYQRLSKEVLYGINNLLWNEEEGIWLDYDIHNKVPRKYFYMSNFVPLWTHSYTLTPKQATRITINYINKVNLTRFIGGSPTSLEHSGEQWDYPNAWPPLQAFFIQGLDRIGTAEASEVAFRFAELFLQSNYKGFKDEGVMYEKYNSEVSGRSGGGGEYEGQTGFGWTNGVDFELFLRWGHILTASSNPKAQSDFLSLLTRNYTSLMK